MDIFRTLERIKTWHLLLIAVIFSEIFTLVLTSIQSIFRRGVISSELIEIGAIDALFVSIMVTFILLPIIRYSANLELEKEILQKEVDERRRVEAALRESERKYRELVENANSIILRWTPRGEIIFLNEFGQKFLGYRENEIIGRNVLDTSVQDGANTRWDLSVLMKSICENPSSYEQNVNEKMLRDGRRVCIAWTNKVVFDTKGTIVEVLSVGTDITELKYAEEGIARERILSDYIINSLPGIFYMCDDDGKLVRWNKKHEEVTGYSPEELLGMYHNDFFAEAHKQYMVSRVQSVFTEGEAFAEAPLMTKSGEQIPYFFTGRLTVLDGRRYFLGVGFDITDRKRAEVEKDALQAQLQQAQKMESVGRLAGGVAHDFNNILTSILGHTDLAMMHSSPSERIYADLKAIEKSALRSAELVRQLLAFARRQTVAPKVLNLNDRVTGMLKMLQRMIGEDIDLVWMPAADLWSIKIDPSQIDQLLANLCINARDAIAGVGKVTIETENTTFDEAYCAGNKGFLCGAYVMLAVSDNGCGMSPDVIEHLFEPFFTTKEVGKGTGLGLATVFGIVKQNEGFINVYSEPDNGTTFKIYLPRFHGKAMEPTSEGKLEKPKGSGETVLLVEDDAAILDVGKAMLEELGYKVLTAGTPGEALRQFKAHIADIQLLITDVVMPEMNGRDLARLMGEIKPGLKCLFTSGYTANVIAHHGVLDDGVNFLQKPFSTNDLALKVHEVLERK